LQIAQVTFSPKAFDYFMRLTPPAEKPASAAATPKIAGETLHQQRMHHSWGKYVKQIN
jgi:hypothetical protein